MKQVPVILLALLFYGSIHLSTAKNSVNYSYIVFEGNDSAFVTSVSLEILKAIKEKDYESLTYYFHPSLGIRFSPYAYIDTAIDVVLTSDEYTNLLTKNKKKLINWGSFDGSGDPIMLTMKNYIKMYVYDVDFFNAEKISFNRILGAGNSQDNIFSVYYGLPFVEFYFSGFEEKYGGMDWRSLKLVFQKYEDRFYLVGIIHSEWTI